VDGTALTAEKKWRSLLRSRRRVASDFCSSLLYLGESSLDLAPFVPCLDPNSILILYGQLLRGQGVVVSSFLARRDYAVAMM
jgi:hypothetical protein